MHTTTIVPPARRFKARLRLAASDRLDALASVWRAWQARRAASALRRRALDLLTTAPSLAADLAAASGGTLDDVVAGASTSVRPRALLKGLPDAPDRACR